MEKTNVPHKSLLTDTHVSNICKAFAKGSSANIELSKTQLFKMVQLGGFIMPGFIVILFPPFKTINSVANSYVKELNKTDTK